MILYLKIGKVTRRRRTPADVSDGNNPIVYYFIGGFVYLGEELVQIATEVGQVKLDTSNTYSYEYFLKDHLGSIRVMFHEGIDSTAEIIQETHYYPYGMRIDGLSFSSTTNDKLFSGKEMNSERLNDVNLNWYDFHARNYDPQLGMWFNVDPMAEKYSSLSPYNYCANNPINYTDPDGMQMAKMEEGRGAIMAYVGYLEGRYCGRGGGGSGGGGSSFFDRNFVTDPEFLNDDDDEVIFDPNDENGDGVIFSAKNKIAGIIVGALQMDLLVKIFSYKIQLIWSHPMVDPYSNLLACNECGAGVSSGYSGSTFSKEEFEALSVENKMNFIRNWQKFVNDKGYDYMSQKEFNTHFSTSSKDLGLIFGGVGIGFITMVIGETITGVFGIIGMAVIGLDVWFDAQTVSKYNNKEPNKLNGVFTYTDWIKDRDGFVTPVTYVYDAISGDWIGNITGL